MSNEISGLDRHVVAPMENCWRHVGVSGDRSCAELTTFIHCRNCPVLAAAARRFFDRPAPEGYLESWQEILEQPDVALDADSRSVLVFRLGDEWLALPTTALVEVASPRQLHRVPHRSNAELAGIVNIRGQLQVCVRLEGFLGLPAPVADGHGTTSASRLLVIGRKGERGEERWVFRVDEVAGLQRVPARTLRDVPATVSGTNTRATKSLFSWQEKMVGLLDEARLLDGLHGRISG
jgi:chemotaxis-related protein WspD